MLLNHDMKFSSWILLASASGIFPYSFAETPLGELDPSSSPYWDDSEDTQWPEGFEVITIPSSLDGAMQRAYAFQSASDKAMPLVVSLHTWSGNYEQHDPLAEKMAKENFNYIHPDFRGPNNTPESCASELAMMRSAIVSRTGTSILDEFISLVSVEEVMQRVLPTFGQSIRFLRFLPGYPLPILSRGIIRQNNAV